MFDLNYQPKDINNNEHNILASEIHMPKLNKINLKGTLILTEDS